MTAFLWCVPSSFFGSFGDVLTVTQQRTIAIFVAVCASLAMCLPFSTPQNALASSTGLVKTKDMARIGIIIGVIGLVLGFFWVTKLFPFPQA